MATANLPEKLGKYQIKALLGQGSMGVVYQGYDADIERTVAIKVIHPHLQDSPSGRESKSRFRQEARAAARCLHPNIVTVFELGQQDDCDFIVMEYVQGEELRFFLETGERFNENECLHITHEVLAGLSHAHQHGIVHRDIKPANIILLDNGGVKIADFGVARLDQSELTMAGNMVGTPTYMSPEGLRGERVEAAGDIYSMGMVLLEMLTGQKPKPQEVFGQSITHFLETVFNSEAGRGVPPKLKSVIRTALAEAPQDRFATADDFSAALEDYTAMHEVRKSAHESLAETVIARSPIAIEQAEVTATPTVWPEAMLDQLEQTLAGYVGPLARVLVMHSAPRAASVEELGKTLAEKIPNEQERKEFLTRYHRCALEHQCSGEHSIAPASRVEEPTIGANTVATQLDESRRKAIATVLAQFVGPLAERLVENHAAKTTSTEAFLTALCECIPNESEREEFRRKALPLSP